MFDANSGPYGDMNQGIDRITDILKRQSTPSATSPMVPQAAQLPPNILNALASASYDYGNGKGGNFVSNVTNYQTNQQNQELAQQKGILEAYNMKLKMGDAQAKALDDKLTLFTGNDPEGKALLLQALHDDPEPIDPTNSYQVMTKLAGIKKRLGYESPDLQLAKQKDQLEVDLLKSKIHATNSLANQRSGVGGRPAKPMPAAALKLQQEGLDIIGTSATINANLKKAAKQLDDGSLELGPVDNVVGTVRNKLGVSTPKSVNYSSFKSNIEKLRNDSLRLNKGVQTEGDAQRAWNELFENINDEKLVKQRLDEIAQLNDRAAALQEMNVNVIRQNYGHEPLNLTGYKNFSLDEDDPRIQQARDAGYSDEEIKQFLEGQ